MIARINAISRSAAANRPAALAPRCAGWKSRSTRCWRDRSAARWRRRSSSSAGPGPSRMFAAADWASRIIRGCGDSLHSSRLPVRTPRSSGTVINSRPSPGRTPNLPRAKRPSSRLTAKVVSRSWRGLQARRGAVSLTEGPPPRSPGSGGSRKLSVWPPEAALGDRLFRHTLGREELLLQCGDRHRPAEEITLALFAAHGGEQVGGGTGLDAFGNHRKPELLAEADG